LYFLLAHRIRWRSILDADIADFFSKLDQAWLMRFLEHPWPSRGVSA